MEELEVDTWVTTTKPGIWQIHRKVKFLTLDPLSGDEVQKIMYFVKRFLNDSLKRSFGEACFCDEHLTALGADTVKELLDFTRENQDIFAKFQAYEPKSISNIYNRTIKVPEGKSVNEIESLISKKKEFTEYDIKHLLHSLDLKADGFPTWTLQFISQNFHCKNNRLLYKFVRINEF